MISTAVVTIVRDRLDHLLGLRRGLAEQRLPGDPAALQHVVVRMGGAEPWTTMHEGPPVVPVEFVMPAPARIPRLPLAAARNTGAAAADADLLIFLDVDCIPGPDLVARYQWAAEQTPGLLAGPVTYLSEGAFGADTALDELTSLDQPHPARPAPPAGQLLSEERYELFWSLSFAVRRAELQSLGGFCEEYVGYGGEDTDLAFLARDRGMPLTWVGGASAWHQYHPVADPPYRHLHDIVSNARVFHRRWGCWPMHGWLRQFADDGLIAWTADSTTIQLTDSDQEPVVKRGTDRPGR